MQVCVCIHLVYHQDLVLLIDIQLVFFIGNIFLKAREMSTIRKSLLNTLKKWFNIFGKYINLLSWWELEEKISLMSVY